MASALQACEGLWRDKGTPEEIDELFQKEYQNFHRKVVVLDDDPTGIQTVHDIDVYTDWEMESLRNAFSSPQNMFFVLTNSRSFSAVKTEDVHREIAEHIARAAKQTARDFLLISRGDSTLRGHFPLETRVLRDTLQREIGMDYAGEIFCPFFREGGRYTINGVHYVKEGTELVPAAQTEFAKDKTFGYAHSDLAGYIREKCAALAKNGGENSRKTSYETNEIPNVVGITLEELRSFRFEELEEKLYTLKGFYYIAVDAVEEADIKALAIVLMRLMKRGKEYLFRSAAAVPRVFGNIPDRPLLTRGELVRDKTDYGGMVVVGSYVKKTTKQLECLKASGLPLEWIEFRASAWQVSGGLEDEAARAAQRAEKAMRMGRTAVVYTSREAVAPQGMTPEQILGLSARIASAVTDVVIRLGRSPRFLIAKGGITSSDIGTRGLRVKRAQAEGQVQPGIPVWKLGPESRFPGMSYIIFPGNAGEEDTLRRIVEMLV